MVAVACSFLASAANTAPGIPQGRLFTANLRSSDVAVYAIPSGTLLARIPLARNPHELALSSDGRFVHTALYHSDLVARIDTASYAVELLPGPPSPHGVVTAGRGVAVTSAEPGSIVLVGTSATTAVGTGRTPHAVAAREGVLAVANAGDDTVSIIRPGVRDGSAAVAVGAVPESVAFTDAGLVLTANAGSNDLSVVDPDALTEVRRIPVGGRPVRVVAVPGTSLALVAATAHEGVAVVDVTSGAVLRWLATGPFPDGIAIAGRWAFTGSTAADRVTLASIEDGTVAASFETPGGPSGLLFLPD